MLCRSYSGSPIGRMIRRLERLYHLAEAENLASILEHGLMSTEGLLAMLGISEPRRAALLCNHRPDSVRLSESVLIRDQRPMPPTALAPALEDGLEPADWYALLNGHVFLWPDRERMDRQRQACGDRPSCRRSIAATPAASPPGVPATRWFRMKCGCGKVGRPDNERARQPRFCSVVRFRLRHPT